MRRKTYPVCSGTNGVNLIEFIVQHEESLVFGVQNPALMSVVCSNVAGPGNDRCVGLVGYICWSSKFSVLAPPAVTRTVNCETEHQGGEMSPHVREGKLGATYVSAG